MKKAYIGIDPGLTGAIAAIMPDLGEVKILPMPISGKEIDVKHISLWINNEVIFRLDWNYDEENFYIIACIEKVHSMPRQGVSSSFKFGFVTGILHGIFRMADIPLYTATPQAWKKEILAGTDKSKQAAIDYCLRAYPDIKLFRTEKSRVYNHNMAEALCIAEYARRKHSVL